MSTYGTALYSRRQPGGMLTFYDVPEHPSGRIWWVDSSAGTDSAGYGQEPNTPLATFDYAVGLASAGDTIYLLPGHAESKAASGNIALVDVAALRIIGLGVGSKTPTFTLGHASATLSITAANVLLRNVKIISDVADCAVGLTLSNAADGAVIQDCWFTDGGLTKELVIGIQVAAACDNILVQRCRFYTTVSAETGGCESAIKLVGETAGSRILDNFALGHYTVACIDASTAASTGVLIRGNVMANIDTGAGLAYSGHASSINVLAYNVFAGTKNNTEPVATVTASYCGENYGIDAAAANAIPSPAVGAFS